MPQGTDACLCPCFGRRGRQTSPNAWPCVVASPCASLLLRRGWIPGCGGAGLPAGAGVRDIGPTAGPQHRSMPTVRPQAQAYAYGGYGSERAWRGGDNPRTEHPRREGLEEDSHGDQGGEGRPRRGRQ